MDLRLIIVLCALAATRAAPQSEIVSGQCALQCKASELNEYPTGQTHVYKYSTQTLVNSWNSKIDLNAEVLLTRMSTCDYSLELRNVAIKGNTYRSWEEKLAARSMKFSWIDGEVSNVCHHPEEEEWVVNMKKAIISSFQVVGTSGYLKKTERDILGDCSTTYQQGELANDRIVMYKVKDIASCQYHHDDKIAAVISSILLDAPKAEYQCKQTWTSKYILKSASCGHVALTQTNVMSNLTLELVKIEPRALTKPFESFRRSQLHASRVQQPKKSIVEVQETLTNLCKAVDSQIKPESPSAFLELAHSLETLSYPEIKQIWESMVNNKLDQRCSSIRVQSMFVDALLQVRNGPTLKFLVKDLSKDENVSEMKLKAAMYSLVYKPEPCAETMEAIHEFLRSDRSALQTLFGVTAAVQKYYEITNDKLKASIALELILGRFNRASEDEKVIFVRALSNIRFDSNILIKTLEKYIESGKPELRVAVIETLELLDACNDLVYGKLRRMVMSTSQPNEIRIRALKVLLRCGDEQVVSQLKSYIESHPEDKHFISYADSYLRNAMKTMNVDKQVIRQNAQLGQQEWKEPKMTVSRNIEFSQRAIYGKIGLNYEIDSIVENDKEMPIWIVLNSSVAIQQANQLNLEVGLRQEGMDKLAMKMFEQINLIKMKDLEKIVEEVKEKRDFEPIVRELTKIIEEIQRSAANSAKLSAYIKINGITLFYWNGVPSSFKTRESLRRFVIENTETRKAIEASLSWMFADYQLNKPLASGLILRYKHEGSFIPGIKASLKPQSAVATSSNRVFEFSPNFAFSFVYGYELVLASPIASQITKMDVNSGILLDGLHSLSKSDASKVHTFVFNAKDEMDILRFDILKTTRDTNGNLINDQRTSPDHNKWCSSVYTDKIFGFALCYDSKAEAFAVVGRRNDHFVRRLYFEKTDSSLKTFEFVVRMDQNEKAISFDTPNTKVNRKVEIVVGKSGGFMFMKNTSGKFWLLVDTPVKSFDFNVSAALQSEKQWIVSVDAQLDRRVHSARLSVEQKSNRQYIANMMAVSPLLREKLDYDLTFTVPLSTSEGNEMMAQIHSNMGNKRNRLGLVKLNRSKQEQYKAEIELNNERAEKLMHIKLDGSIRGSYPVFTGLHYSGKVEYRRALGKMEEVLLTGNYKIDTTGEAKAVTNNLEIKATQWPLVNGKIAHKMFFKQFEHLENDVDMRWGLDYADESTLNRIIVRQVSSMKAGAKNTVEVKNSLILENRAKQFNHKVEGRITYAPRFEVLKAEMTHSDLTHPANNHKIVIDHKTTALSEGTLNLVLSSTEESRSVKTSYALTSSPKLNTIYKVEQKGQPVRGYHFSAAINKAAGKHQAAFEILSHPENKQIAKFEADLNRERSKTAANLKVSLRERTLLSAAYDRNGHQIKSKVSATPGSLEGIVDLRAKSMKLITKDSNELVHELSAINARDIKSIKSKTLSGPKLVPTFEIKLDTTRKHLEFNLQTIKYDVIANLKNNVEKELSIEFRCAEHGDKHSTHLKWADNYKLLTSSHERNQKPIYVFELRSENNNELVHKMVLKVGDKFESRAQHVYNQEKRLSKIDWTAIGQKLDAKISYKIALPMQRSRFSSMEMPSVDIKALFKYDGKESSVVISNDRFTKIHIQHRNQAGVPLVLDSKFESDKWSVVGHADQLKWSIFVTPKESKKSVDVSLEGYGKDIKLNLALEQGSSQWMVNGQSKIIVNGDKKIDGRIESTFAKTLIAGPHRIVMKSFDKDISMNYRLVDNKLDITLEANDNGQKLIAANFNGEKFQRGRVFNINGALTLSSDRHEFLRKTAYEVRYNRDGRKHDMEVAKKGSNPMNLKLSGEVAREGAKINVEMNGRTASGKQRKLVIDYTRLNKVDFSAKIYEMSKVDSEVTVSLPLVSIAEFIGNEASFHLRSKSLDSEASFQLKAPSKTSVTGLVDLKIRGKQLVQYNLAINDGSSVQFFGLEKVNNKLENPIAILNELYIVGRPIFFHHILVSDNLISLKVESPNSFKINQALTLAETPEVFGKYCWASRCSKMESKWVLGEKGLVEMRFEGPNRDTQRYDVSFKWNQEQGKEYGSVLVATSGRQYGYEMSRMIKNARNAVYESRFTLPRRVMTITATKDEKLSSVEKYQGQWSVVIRPKENADPLKINLDQSIKRSSNNMKADYVFSVEHKTLSNPIKVISSVNMVKSNVPKYNIWGIKSADVKMGLNLNGQESHDFNSAFYMEKLQDKMNYNWRVWQKDEKIDFGCKGVFSSSGSFKAKDLQTLRECNCHWVDRNGERKEFKREQAFNMKDLISLNRGLPHITFHDNMKHPFGSYFYNGTFRILDAIKDAAVDFNLNDGSRYQVQARLDVTKPQKCIELTIFEANNAEDKYGLRTCLNLKARSDNSVFLFEIFTFGNQISMTEGERKVDFSIKRMKDYVNDYLIRLQWDTNSMAQATYQAVDLLERASNQRDIIVNERNHEVEAKMEYIRSSIGEKIGKAKGYFNRELNEITDEMRPEREMISKMLKKVTRTRRAAITPLKRRNVDLSSKMSYEWKTYDLEGGHIELLLRNVETQKIPLFVYEVLLKNPMIGLN
uniref:Apolipophorins-like n=1 Tax=Tetranychus evansi TaxID=178897 RepID=A0A3G5API0_9ACAR|nr:apolipophorins-like [Tetranychus evansi]